MNSRTLCRWAFTLAALAAFVNATPGLAQQRGTIRGTVREADTQRPMPGVQVFVPGTQMTTVTDAQGRFEFAGVTVGGVQVRVRAVGYSAAFATATVVGGQAVTVDFALNKSVVALDEVVVTGTGATVERKQLGNTIATVRADAIRDAPVRSFSEVLVGREAGVTILPGSGTAGEGSRIRIRGNASLAMGGEPVVYVDGVRVDNGGTFTGTGAGGTGVPSKLDDINPEIIERVEILKGAAAATLYGSEASAGVIQIFTKKGSQGRPRFSFRVDQGLARYPKNRLEDNWGWARTAVQSDTLNALFGNVPVNFSGQFDNADGKIDAFEVFSVPGVSPTAYYGTGYNSTYSVNVTGGGADATYNLSARYAREDGPYDVTDLIGPYFLDQGLYEHWGNPKLIDYNRRYQVSANTTLFPKDRVTLSAGLMYSDLHHRTPDQANNIYGVQSSLLNSRFFSANCRASIARGLGNAYGVDPNRPGHCAGPGNEWGTLSFGTPREAAMARTSQDGDHFTGNVKATYEPLQGRLRGDLTVGVDITNTRDAGYMPFANDLDGFTNQRDLGFKQFGSRFNRELSVDARVNWRESFGTFSSQLTGGTQGFITKRHSRQGFGGDFPGPGLEVADAGSAQTVAESFSNVVNIGLMGEEQIGYNEWAFLTVGGRWDRNSAFGENTSGKFYPKASISLVLSDMPNWSTGLVSTLRVRGAVGRSGLQPGAFDRISTFGPTVSQFGSGLIPDNLGNPDLKPEETTEIEAGAEIAVLDNRLAFDITRWQRKTLDLLVPVQYAPSGGFLNRQLTNVGEMEAKGWELKVNALVVDRPGLSVNLFASGAHLFQRILDMGGAPPIKAGGSYQRYRNWLVEGQWPGALLGAQILQPCGQTRGPRCLTGDQVPFDTNADGVPDTRAQLEAYLSTLRQCSNGTSYPSYVDCFNSPTGIGPLLDDNNGDGDLLNNCIAPVGETRGKTKVMSLTKTLDKGLATQRDTTFSYDYCLSKSMPDWTGAFGTNISLGSFQVSALFDFKAGNFVISNLTDGFRNSNPAIGRNNKRPAELDAIMNNPASTGAERAEALLEFTDVYKELSPYDGLNLGEKGDFIRFREVGITYTAPASFAQKLGFGNLSLNLTGRNMQLWTGYQGIEPEMNEGSNRAAGVDNQFLDGIDSWGFPLPRRFTFSVRFGF